MNDKSLLQLLLAASAAAPGKTALVTPAASLSFSALIEGIENAAFDLAGTGAQAAAPVLIREGSGIDFITRFFAAMRAQRPAFVLPAGLQAFAMAGLDLEQSARAGHGEFYWGLTSGSMGEPKIFARGHRSWIESFRACEGVFPFAPDDVVMVPGSLTHSLFLYAAVHSLCRGLTVLLPERFSPRSVVSMMQAHRASVAYAVPPMLGELAKRGAEMPSLRRVFVGGARLQSGLRQQVEALWRDADIVEFYGASELSFVSFSSTRKPGPPGSVGRLFPGVRVEIRSREGKPKPPGAPGLIYVASPMLFSRYVLADSAGTRQGEWITAGDQGYLDDAGFLCLTGRADREINCKGRKLSPEAIEAVLLGADTIRRAAVIAVPDVRRGEIAAAVVEPKAGLILTKAALYRHCRAHLPLPDMPLIFIEAEVLPTTRTGKIAFATLKQRIASGAPGYRVLK